MITINLESEYYRTYGSGFIDVLNVHDVYLHCLDLGHFKSIGVRGESTINKRTPVSSSFGFLIIDSLAAPHDKNRCVKTTDKHRSIYFSQSTRCFSPICVTID